MSIQTLYTSGLTEGTYNFVGKPSEQIRSVYSVLEGQMMSVGNRNYPHSGSAWYCHKKEDLRSFPSGYWFQLRRSYEGQIALMGPTTSVPPSNPAFIPHSESKLDSLGTTAIARTEPTDSEWSAAQFIGELRSGMPSAVGSSLFKDRVKAARSAGGEYLNVEFGWKPLVADFKAFIKGIEDTDAIISQYKRDSDRQIRRRMILEQQSNTDIHEDITFNVAPNPGTTVGWAKGLRIYSNSQRTWFSGAYKYHVPNHPGNRKIADFALKMRRIHGLEITPEVIWNVAPWSWAADWFGTTGDVMHNLSALGRDGLVLKYGYVMHETIAETRDIAGTIPDRRNTISVPLERLQRASTKVRKPATPYGFGFDMSSMSAKQIAITTALGLSKT